MATYQIHGIQKKTATGDFRGIFFSTPRDITVYRENNKISVTIPDNSCMHLDNDDEGQYYDFNYCAYISLVYKKKNGDIVQLPSKSIIEEMERQAYKTGENPDDVNYLPTEAEFLKFKKHIVLFKIGSTVQQTNWTVYVPGDSDRILTFDGPDPDEVESYDVYICGCSINTSTYATYIRKKYATTGYKEWLAVNSTSNTATIVNKEGGGGNACNCAAEYHETTGVNVNNKLWESNGVGGAISVISDGYGNAKINIPNFTVGAGNKITATAIKIQFQDKNGTVKKSITKNATGSYTEAIPAGATKVYVEANGTSKYGSNVSKNKTLKVYTKPSVANLQISWDSNSRKTDNVPNNIKADATSKLKDNITWSWSGAKAGINTPIAGYRIFVYKSIGHKLLAGKSRYSYTTENNKVKLKTTLSDNEGNPLNGNSLPLAKTMKVNGKDENVFSLSFSIADSKVTAATTYYDTHYFDFDTNATSGSISFNPKAAGFENKDYCIFEVILYYNWKNSESANAVTEYATPITSEPENDCYSGAIGKSCNCYFKNSANVWVKTVDSTNASAWKEAESIWVKTSSGWKEAEGLWVKTDTNTWSESS